MTIMSSAIPFTPPVFEKQGFNCPFCNAYALQKWICLNQVVHDQSFGREAHRFSMSCCPHCGRVSMWHDQVMILPNASSAPMAHADMPESLLQDYNEARSLLGMSPRSSAALLRLIIQKLCVILGQKGENINADIGSLVAKGLPVQVQQALDIVRVVGNEQVHPGQLDVRDDPEVAVELFNLVNFIVQDQISRPKTIESLYARLPKAKLQGIENRDKVKQGEMG